VMLPAHGPAGGSVHARIDALLDHHDVRLAQAAEVLKGGRRTAYEVASELRWTSRQRLFTDLDPFNQMLAVLETALHLDLLADRGAVAVREVAGVLEYAERDEDADHQPDRGAGEAGAAGPAEDEASRDDQVGTAEA